MRTTLLLFLLSAMMCACESEPTLNKEITDAFDDGSPAKVIFKDQNGKVVREERYHIDGKIHMTGTFNESGQRHGEWKAYYPDGKPWSKNYYTDGESDKAYATYWPNGTLRTKGQYTLGDKIGKWTFYDDKGQITEEVDF